MDTQEFFVRCASGFEPLLAEELKDLGIKRIRPLKGGVAFFGFIEQAYRACLWSRVASRVILILDRVEARDAESLYEGVYAIDWVKHIGPEATIALHAHGLNEELRNTQFTAVKTKDAICDKIRSVRGSRPDVRSDRPDVAIDVTLRIDRATISIDLSGEPLHRRAYRETGKQVLAPLKENLAAAVVLKSGWKDLASSGAAFLDPMCGSGTLAIEAAMIAADAAPGILRDYWGFEGWYQHDEDLWQRLIDEADERFARGLTRMPRIMGSDHDENCIALAQENAKRAGLSAYIDFYVADVSALGSVLHEDDVPGLLATNPPYGERLSSPEQLPQLYTAFAEGVKALKDGWRIAVITPDDSMDTALGFVPDTMTTFYNGRIEAILREYLVDQSERISVDVILPSTGETKTIFVAEKNSAQFVARLRKVAKERRKWAQRQGISCYRVYDADLPDYAVAIDLYEGSASSKGQSYLVIAEYRAPKTIDEDRAQRRYNDVIALAPYVLEVSPDLTFSKVRRREKGGGQYRDEQKNSYVAYTQESGYLFEVDFGGYLDTGLFLDHRLTRELVGSLAQGKRFLNLFAYTGAATVHAAGAGAASTTTVDLSQTYLSWAKRNMALNEFKDGVHSYIRADVEPWLSDQLNKKHEYDLIFVDPPTFSNSKAMGNHTWSVERDHVRLLLQVVGVLSPDGIAIFSCNQRNFKPDYEALNKAGVLLEDITAQTIPEDFKRNPKIHKCYLVKRPN